MHAKRILLLHLSFFFLISAFGQTKTNVSFTNSDRSALQIEMERSISGLLTELNKASARNRVPRLQNLKITEECATRIGELWDNASMSSPEGTINAKLILTSEFSAFGRGYQVRNIPLALKGKDGRVGKEMGVITMNSVGQIPIVTQMTQLRFLCPQRHSQWTVIPHNCCTWMAQTVAPHSPTPPHE